MVSPASKSDLQAQSPLYRLIEQDEAELKRQQVETETTPIGNKLPAMAKIWHIVAMIPEGKISSYGKIADYAGLPGRARYVSKALKAAPAHLSLPWHRVLNSQGRISVEKNSMLFQQQMALLREEGVIVSAGRVKLAQFEWRPDMVTLVLDMPF